MPYWALGSGVCDRMWHSRAPGFHLRDLGVGHNEQSLMSRGCGLACSWVAGNAQSSRHARLGCGARDEVISGCAVGYHSRDLEGCPLRAISFESWANERILCVERASSPPCAAVDVGSLLWAENIGGRTFSWRVTILWIQHPESRSSSPEGLFSPNFMLVPPARTKTRMTFVLCHNNVN